MDVEQEIKELKEEVKQQERYPVYTCWPISASGWRLCGLVLVALGAFWLLGNAGLAETVLWPLLFIGLGLFYLSRARDERHP